MRVRAVCLVLEGPRQALPGVVERCVEPCACVFGFCLDAL
jgi:hypothetical protein